MTRFVKLFSLFALMFVCVMAVMALTNKTVKADTEPNEAVSALMASYVGTNKQYTKLTQLETENIKGTYHAGASQAKRRTYYDEGVDALLMGDYDGGFTTINSGYAKNESDMQHYRNNAETITTENLFTSKKVDYTVMVTSPNEYFDNLSELAKKSGECNDWVLENGVYTYTAPAVLSGTGSSPTNPLLKMFQYFSAPMVLVSSVNNLQKVQVYESGFYPGTDSVQNMLVIELYDSSDKLLSTAYVVDGLTMQDVIMPMQAVIGGQEYNMVINAGATGDNLEREFQLKANVDVSAFTSLSFKINGGPADVYAHESNGGNYFDGNIVVEGSTNIYLKCWEDGTQSFWVSTAHDKIYLLVNDNWASNSARFAAYFFQKENNTTVAETWVSLTKVSGNIYCLEAPEGSWTHVIFCRMNGSATENNWDNKWNQTPDLEFRSSGVAEGSTYNDNWNCGWWSGKY